jgi:calcium/calmodulin-dependent protein kinase (CaM kinase) II
MNEQEMEIIELTRKLIDSVVNSDWQTYTALCAEDLTSFEPEAEGYLIEGMAFHKHYFEMKDRSPYAGVTTTLSTPRVRVMGDVAVIAYVRVTQRADKEGASHTTTSRETRVWHRLAHGWKHVHFHRS